MPNPNPNDVVASKTISIYVCPSDVNPPPVETRNPYMPSDFYTMVSASRRCAVSLISRDAQS